MPKIRVLRSRASRLRGLMGTAPTNDIVVLVPCHDVHTFGMSYPLDLAFIDKYGRVLKTYRNVEPGSRLRCVGAHAVLERAADAQVPWFAPRRSAGRAIERALQVKE